MEKRMWSVLVAGIIVFSLSTVGCKKAEQPTQTTNPAEQPRASELSTVEGFRVFSGSLEKGGLGYILSADKDKTAVALKKTSSAYKKIVTIKGQMKANIPSGTRNGFILFGESPKELSKGLIRMGGKSLALQGPFVENVEKLQNFDPNKVFNTEMVINLENKTVTWKVDGAELKTHLTNRPASIGYIGYAVWQAQTQFSELEISGE